MIKGIAGNAYLNLDSYLDLEPFKALHESICAGIARSKRIVGSYGDGALKPSGYFDLWDAVETYHSLSVDHPIRLQGKALEQDPGAFKCYLKLVLGAYAPSSSVYLKSYRRYTRKSYAQDCYWEDNAKFFPELINYINTLPFTEYGRVLFFLHEHNSDMLIHSDVREDRRYQPHRSEFLWLRTKLDKDFFIFDPDTNKKYPVESYSAFFNDHDFHGGRPTKMMTFSLRIDGFFTEEFREKIGIGRLSEY